MRKTIYHLLTTTPALTALVPAERWFAAGNVVDNPPKPFVVLRWITPTRLSGGRFARQLRIDAHDERGSYANVLALLGNPDAGSGVYGVLSGLQDYVGTDGRITQADFLGTSGDQEDPDYNSNYMYSSWQLIGVDL